MIAIRSERINLRRNKSWIYLGIILFIFLGLLTFLTSNIFMDEKEKIYHTELNSPISLSSIDTLTINSWVYNPQDRSMEVVMKIDTEDKKYSFKAVAKSNPTLQLPIKDVYTDGGDRVIKIENISPDWGAIALDVYQKDELTTNVSIDESYDTNEEEDSSGTIIKTLYSDQKKVDVNNNLKTKSTEEYALDFVKYDEKDARIQLKKYRASVKEEQKNIKVLSSDIKDLKEDKEYQTKDEIAETDSKIMSLQMQIDDKKKNIETINLAIENNKDKLKKLEEKRKDLQN